VLLEFRASFLPAFLAVANRIAETFGITPSGRPEKTPESIMAKLAREGTRLSRMQDIAGCRIVVPSRVQQDGLVDSLSSVFPDHRLVDRREQPRHGYRAVHVIVREQGRPVEIQVRTDLQHQWANLVEWSASFGGDLKHGVELPGDARLLGVATDQRAHRVRARASCRHVGAAQRWRHGSPSAFHPATRPRCPSPSGGPSNPSATL